MGLWDCKRYYWCRITYDWVCQKLSDVVDHEPETDSRVGLESDKIDRESVREMIGLAEPYREPVPVPVMFKGTVQSSLPSEETRCR